MGSQFPSGYVVGRLSSAPRLPSALGESDPEIPIKLSELKVSCSFVAEVTIPDGVFVRDGEGTRFVALPGPSDEDGQEVLRRIVRRVRRLLRPGLDVAQADARPPDALAAAQAERAAQQGGSCAVDSGLPIVHARRARAVVGRR